MSSPRHLLAGAGVLLALVLSASGARAQGSELRQITPDDIRQLHMVHVSPHLVVFDPRTKSTTLEFSNEGNRVVEADVVIELGFTAWQNRDTALFTSNWQQERAHDTVIVAPGTQEHYAGRWLSGVPTHVVLHPHERQRVTLRIDPPPGVADGEYYARIVTLSGIRQRRDPSQRDTRAVYVFPFKGKAPPPLRDSVRVFYRQGQQTMGLAIRYATAQIDTTSPWSDVGAHPLRILLRVHLTGTAHFEGYLSVWYVSEYGEIIQLTAVNGAAFTLHRDGVMRWIGETDQLTPGHYTVVVRFTERQEEFTRPQRLPMDPVQVEIPFDYRTD